MLKHKHAESSSSVFGFGIMCILRITARTLLLFYLVVNGINIPVDLASGKSFPSVPPRTGLHVLLEALLELGCMFFERCNVEKHRADTCYTLRIYRDISDFTCNLMQVSARLERKWIKWKLVFFLLSRRRLQR